jgi:hypothetical protein
MQVSKLGQPLLDCLARLGDILAVKALRQLDLQLFSVDERTEAPLRKTLPRTAMRTTALPMPNRTMKTSQATRQPGGP